MTTTTLPEPYLHGSYPPSEEVAPPSLCSVKNWTNSPSTIGVSSPRLTDTEPWTSNASHCAVKLTSSSRRSRWLGWSIASAKGGSRQPEQTTRSATCNWGKWEPERSKIVFEQTWCARTTKPAMDMGIHSAEERGVTGLG